MYYNLNFSELLTDDGIIIFESLQQPSDKLETVTNFLELTNVSSLPLTANLSLVQPFQLTFEKNGRLVSKSEEVRNEIWFKSASGIDNSVATAYCDGVVVGVCIVRRLCGWMLARPEPWSSSSTQTIAMTATFEASMSSLPYVIRNIRTW